MAEGLKILVITSELGGFSKSGGLADAVGALSQQLVRMGHDLRVITPAYASVEQRNQASTVVDSLGVPLDSGEIWCRVLESSLEIEPGASLPKVPVYLVEHEHFFSRKDFYGENGQEYPDNAQRFGFLSKTALQLGLALDWIPDIFHAHDWHAALVPYFLQQIRKTDSRFRKSRSILTIHNAGYQGRYPGYLKSWLKIDDADFHPDCFEDFGGVNLLKGGMLSADQVNTVSPGYAEELKTPLGGHGLHPFYQRLGQDFSGILNGCDYGQWNPEIDPHLPANYSSSDRRGKVLCKTTLLEEAGLKYQPNIPLVGMVSRLTGQKGFSFLIPALQEILEMDLQLVLLGDGEPGIADALKKIRKSGAGKFYFKQGYDNRLAHLIEAGCDFYLMPSLYEPCGLNQIYSLRYGTLPIVRKVGGLKDTVEDYRNAKAHGNGFMFQEPTEEALIQVMRKALQTFQSHPKIFKKMISDAMNQRFLWENSAKSYQKLYHKALSSQALERPRF